MDRRRNTPWYKWRLTLAGSLLILNFGYVAWQALFGTDRPSDSRIVGTAFFGVIAIAFVLTELRNRKSQRLNAREDKADEET